MRVYVCVNTEQDDDVDFAIKFCEGLRRKPWASDSFFIFIIESNYGGTPRSAQFIRALESRFAPCFSISEDIENRSRPGVWVTADYKERFVQHWNKLLYNDLLVWHDDVYSESCADPRNVLLEQMRGFKRELRPVNIHAKKGAGTFVEPKLPYKYSGKGGGKKDDVMMTAMECAYFLAKTIEDPHYLERAGKLPMGHAEGRYIANPNGGLVGAQFVLSDRVAARG